MKTEQPENSTKCKQKYHMPHFKDGTTDEVLFEIIQQIDSLLAAAGQQSTSPVRRLYDIRLVVTTYLELHDHPDPIGYLLHSLFDYLHEEFAFEPSLASF